MKINFITPSSHTGILSRNSASKTELAWQIALQSDHSPINQISWIKDADLSIVILPKNLGSIVNRTFFGQVRMHSKHVAVMQEGPSWYFQDYSAVDQQYYWMLMNQADFLLAHNKADAEYFKGIFGKPTYTLPTVLIEDTLKNLPAVEQKGIIIGGNFCRWYGGFDSYKVALSIVKAGELITIPSMGRKITDEESFPGLKHLPFLDWKGWMEALRQHKIAIHLMPTQAAGSFALNCAYFEIPCIGYEGLDTQSVLHPNLTIPMGGILQAKALAHRLASDPDFHRHQSQLAMAKFRAHYSEAKFLEHFNETFAEYTAQSSR